MKASIFNKIFGKNNDPEKVIVKSPNTITGRFRAKIIRADGSIEYGFGADNPDDWHENQMLAQGLNIIAALAVGSTGAGSAFAYLGVGTVTAAASLGSTVTGFGEVSRKAPVTLAYSGEVFFMVATWGGAADSITSVQLESAAMLNHASSGEGQAANIITGVSGTLADSDFLNLECQIQVGSHAI